MGYYFLPAAIAGKVVYGELKAEMRSESREQKEWTKWCLMDVKDGEDAFCRRNGNNSRFTPPLIPSCVRKGKEKSDDRGEIHQNKTIGQNSSPTDSLLFKTDPFFAKTKLSSPTFSDPFPGLFLVSETSKKWTKRSAKFLSFSSFLFIWFCHLFLLSLPFSLPFNHSWHLFHFSFPFLISSPSFPFLHDPSSGSINSVFKRNMFLHSLSKIVIFCLLLVQNFVFCSNLEMMFPFEKRFCQWFCFPSFIHPFHVIILFHLYIKNLYWKDSHFFASFRSFSLPLSLENVVKGFTTCMLLVDLFFSSQTHPSTPTHFVCLKQVMLEE